MTVAEAALTTQEGEKRAPLIAGTFLFFLAFYLLSGPGRIDIIDGQHRFDVAWNLVTQGRPVVTDRFLPARVGTDGFRYSFYGPAASFAGVPLVWIGSILGEDDRELARFLFSFGSSFFAAASLALLVAWWLRLGILPKRALGWAFVVGCASLLWPTSTSVFDQSQHAFFVLASVYAGFRSTEGPEARRWAAISGASAGILVLYQMPYVVFGPVLALSVLDRESPLHLRPALPRLLLFALPWTLCLAAWGAYNQARFGSLTDFGALPGHPLWGNPFVGLLDLVMSPGKGILWYSPIVLLQIWSLPTLWRRFRFLFLPVGLMAVCHLLFIASMSFHGGDWCWGPRYLVTTLPLLSLGLPFLSAPHGRRWIVKSVIVVGLAVQLLGVSMDHQGFFFAHSLRPWFWTDSWANFRRSQLVYRVRELAELSMADVDIAQPFRPGANLALSTYTPFGPPPSVPTAEYPRWMKRYPVFYLPRPWPLWMRCLPEERRPVPLVPATTALTGMLVLGMLWMRRGVRVDDRPESGERP